MKKIICFWIGLLCAFQGNAQDRFMTGQTNKIGQYKYSKVISDAAGNVIFPTNVFITNGFLRANYETNSIPSFAVQDLQLTQIVFTNFGFHVGSGTADTFTEVGSLATTASNGSVIVSGQASSEAASISIWLRIRDSLTNANSTRVFKVPAAPGSTTIAGDMPDNLSGVPKTYFIDVASDSLNVAYTNAYDTGTSPPLVNGLGIFIKQSP